MIFVRSSTNLENNTDKPKHKLITKLKNKYRLVIMNDATYEEKVSLVLSPLNVFVVAGGIILFFIIFTTYLIAFTGLREYIPGYSSDVTVKRNLLVLSAKVDSVEEAMQLKDEYLKNILHVVDDKITAERSPMPKDSTKRYRNISLSSSGEDSILRNEIENQDKYSLAVTENKVDKSGIRGFLFFSPLNGVVTNSYKASPNHYGIDIAAKKNDAVKSTLDGTVIFASWTLETGYVMQIQHSNDLVSIYKHNSALLKKVGDRVNVGEAIAIVGNSGEYTSGPHLHFELWYQGKPINPQDYINF